MIDAVRHLMHKVKNLIKIARVVSVDDSLDVRVGVMGLLGKEQRITIASLYGYSYVPPTNSAGPVWQIDGEESKMVGIFDRPDTRPVKNLESGEVLVGNHSTGDYVRFKDGNIVEINSANAGGKIVVQIDGGDNLQLEEKDADAKMTLGDGAKSVAVADDLQTLYTQLSTEISKFNTHVHTSAAPGSPTSNPTVAVPPTVQTPPAWDPNINSDKAKIPSN